MTKSTFRDEMMMARQKQHMSLEALAAKTGLRSWTVFTIESGVIQPRLNTAQRICKALGITYTIG